MTIKETVARSSTEILATMNTENYPWLEPGKTDTVCLEDFKKHIDEFRSENGAEYELSFDADLSVVLYPKNSRGKGAIIAAYPANSKINARLVTSLLNPLVDLDILTKDEVLNVIPKTEKVNSSSQSGRDHTSGSRTLDVDPNALAIDRDELTAAGRLLAEMFKTIAVTDPKAKALLTEAVVEDLERRYAASAARNDQAKLARLTETSGQAFDVIKGMGVKVDNWRQLLEKSISPLTMDTPEGLIAAFEVYTKLISALLAAQTIASEAADSALDRAIISFDHESEMLRERLNIVLATLRAENNGRAEVARLKAQGDVDTVYVETSVVRLNAEKQREELAAIKHQKAGLALKNTIMAYARVIPAPLRGALTELVQWTMDEPFTAGGVVVASLETIYAAFNWSFEQGLVVVVATTLGGAGLQAIVNTISSEINKRRKP